MNIKTQNNTGIWIDSKEAVIVSLKNNEESVEHVYSGVEGQIRIDGETKSYTRMGNQYMTEEGKKEAKHDQQLKEFYKNILPKIKDAETIYIMGPAETKNELQKFISQSTAMAAKAIIVDTADRLTENQIVAKVKAQFPR